MIRLPSVLAGPKGAGKHILLFFLEHIIVTDLTQNSRNPGVMSF